MSKSRPSGENDIVNMEALRNVLREDATARRRERPRDRRVAPRYVDLDADQLTLEPVTPIEDTLRKRTERGVHRPSPAAPKPSASDVFEPLVDPDDQTFRNGGESPETSQLRPGFPGAKIWRRIRARLLR